MAVVASVNADLDGDGQVGTVQSTDDGHTTVVRNGVVLWDHEGWIQGWNRRPWDGLLAADVDQDGAQEIVIWNNQDGWTGVLKWQAGALALLWASPSPLHGPAGQWNRRSGDQFSRIVYDAQIAVAVVHPPVDFWSGVLVWQSNALMPVLITQGPLPPPPMPTWMGAQATETSITLYWRGPAPGPRTFDGLYTLFWTAPDGSQQGGATRGESYTVAGLAAGTTYFFQLSYVAVDGRTSAIASESIATKPGPPPPPVPVPQIVGQTETQALATLNRAGLREGNVVNQSVEFRTDYLKVIQQSPLSGRRVPPGTAVDMTVTAVAQAVTGFSQVVIYNENTDGRAVQTYLIDLTNNNPQNMGSVPVQGRQVLALQDGHVYEIVAVDVGLEGCPGLDPTNVSCQRSLSFANGQKGGPSLDIVVP